MANGNHRMRPAAIVISIMATLIGAGVTAVFIISMATASDHTDHEASAEAHPVIQNAVQQTAVNVKEIDGKVDTMMLIQERQTVILEEIGKDVAELK